MPANAAAATTGKKKNAMEEFHARTYASWLAWWKNTVNTDDYMKYLSTMVMSIKSKVFNDSFMQE